MEGAMEGMKKQAVMMCVQLSVVIILESGVGVGWWCYSWLLVVDCWPSTIAGWNPVEGTDTAIWKLNGRACEAVLTARVPNMVIMQYINVFFSGFILSKSSTLTLSGGITITTPHASTTTHPYSQAAIPIDARLQVSFISGYRHARSGRSMGIVSFNGDAALR
jgi:hypothetical protein